MKPRIPASSAGVLLLAAWMLAGCGNREITHNTNDIAAQHMAAGDSLEQQGSLREATEEFSIVAQLYQETGFYREAVRKTTMLHLNPSNPMASDSSAFRWLTVYLGLPGADDRGDLQLAGALLRRLSTLHDQATRLQTTVDSLSLVLRKQTATNQSQSQRLQEVENDLQATRKELARLKAIDVRLSGGRHSK